MHNWLFLFGIVFVASPSVMSYYDIIKVSDSFVFLLACLGFCIGILVRLLFSSVADQDNNATKVGFQLCIITLTAYLSMALVGSLLGQGIFDRTPAIILELIPARLDGPNLSIFIFIMLLGLSLVGSLVTVLNVKNNRVGVIYSFLNMAIGIFLVVLYATYMFAKFGLILS